MNGDGQDDIVCAGADGSVAIYSSTGEPLRIFAAGEDWSDANFGLCVHDRREVRESNL